MNRAGTHLDCFTEILLELRVAGAVLASVVRLLGAYFCFAFTLIFDDLTFSRTLSSVS